MNYTFLFLIPLILVVMALVVYSLIRGLGAFINAKGIHEVDNNAIPESFKIQNSMMLARVKWQAIAILLVVIIGYSAS